MKLYYAILLVLLLGGFLFRHYADSESAENTFQTLSRIFLIGSFAPLVLIFIVIGLDKIWQKFRK